MRKRAVCTNPRRVQGLKDRVPVEASRRPYRRSGKFLAERADPTSQIERQKVIEQALEHP